MSGPKEFIPEVNGLGFLIYTWKSVYQDLCTLINQQFLNYQKDTVKESHALTSVTQLVGISFRKLRGHRFNSWSGQMPRLQVRSLVRACARSNRSMFLSHFDVSLPRSSLTFSKSMSMSSGEAKINKYIYIYKECHNSLSSGLSWLSTEESGSERYGQRIGERSGNTISESS